MEIDVPTPPGVQLLNHQIENVMFTMGRKVSLIADPPGLGKTGSAIAACNVYAVKRVLIICPASLKLNWVKEWKLFSTHTELTVGVATSKLYPQTDVVIVNYEIVQKLHEELIRQTWDIVILDEAHAIKNADAKRTQYIIGKKLKKKPIKGIPHRKMILLTGTPMLNRPHDLWTFCQLADPTGLGKDYYSFVKRYCAAWNSPWGLDTSGASNLDELKSKLYSSFLIRHDKGIINLPPKIRSIIELPTDGLGVDTLIKKEMALYEKASKSFDLEGEDFDEQVAKLTEEQASDKVQVMTDLAATRQEVALKKLPMVCQFIDNIVQQGEKVIIFCYHRAVAQELQARFPNAAVMTGETTPQTKRQAAVERFQGEPDCTEFIGQIKAAGVGHTLTASRTVVFAEMDYVPANLEQAEDRAYRISQDRTVNVYYLVLQGSLDSTIANRVVQKRKVIDQVMGTNNA